MIRRASEPYAGAWALPGGFVEIDEDLSEAAERELEEETGVRIGTETLTQVAHLRDARPRPATPGGQRGLAGGVPRDRRRDRRRRRVPRGVACRGRPADEDPADRLAFDHAAILRDAVEAARERLVNAELPLLAAGFTGGGEFSLSQLRAVYEAVLGHELDAGNFQRKVKTTQRSSRPPADASPRRGGPRPPGHGPDVPAHGSPGLRSVVAGVGGSAMVNRVSPGRLVRSTVPPWAATIACTSERPSPVPPGARRGSGSCRRGRSARRRRARSGAKPGPSSATDDRASRRRRGATPTVTVVPGGVCVRALASRFVTTWCSRGSSPRTVDRLVGQVEAPAVVGAGGLGVADRVEHQPGQVDRSPLPAAGRRPAGPAAAGPRPATVIRPPRTRPGQRVRDVRRRRRGRAGSARRTRGWWRAGCAARGWRRRRTGGPASRCACRALSASRRGRACG